jgi:hypothetical protein
MGGHDELRVKIGMAFYAMILAEMQKTAYI